MQREHAKADEKVTSEEEQVRQKQKETMDKLNTQSGQAFGKAFLEAMIEDHEKALDTRIGQKLRLEGGLVNNLITDLQPAFKSIYRNPGS